MRRLARIAARGLALIGVLIVGVIVFGPHEPSDLTARFNPATMGDDLDAYFSRVEARFDDIVPGVEKRVIWAGEPGQRTPTSILYIHGFSATSEEIRPVPDRIAAQLGANLIYTRLRGHGRGSSAMAEATVADWMRDVAEGLTAARRAGGKVVIMATSTGATLAVGAAKDRDMARDVAGMILVSPNFGINNPMAPLLTWPGARYWLPLLAGHERSFEPANDMQARYWTTRYASVAVLPMAALVKRVAGLDVGQIKLPTLFWYSDHDRVVRPDITDLIAQRWGGPATIHKVEHGAMGPSNAHVVTGDALAPDQTEIAVRKMTRWLRDIVTD
ncbi:alpha/beta hydrolase [Arenibacterium sp. CAU 1754]